MLIRHRQPLEQRLRSLAEVGAVRHTALACAHREGMAERLHDYTLQVSSDAGFGCEPQGDCMATETVFRQLPLARAGDAEGSVVVVDVLRAFTSVAYALHRGAVSIHLVTDVEEAKDLRREGVVDLVLGEVGGLPVDGFDLSNSPSEIAAAELTGMRLAMRTSAGTQGAVSATGATRMLTGAFVNASATAEALQGADLVTFLITGESHGRDGDEDRALADYLTALLSGSNPAPEPYLSRVRHSDHGRRFGEDLPVRDLELACELDRFSAPIAVLRRGDEVVISPVMNDS